jgi:hypothetical protein
MPLIYDCDDGGTSSPGGPSRRNNCCSGCELHTNADMRLHSELSVGDVRIAKMGDTTPSRKSDCPENVCIIFGEYVIRDGGNTLLHGDVGRRHRNVTTKRPSVSHNNEC